MVFGYDGAFFGTTYARASFKSAFGITAMSAADQTNTSANLTSSYLAAAFFGALFAWPTMETLGRRFAIQIASVIFLIGAAVMTGASSQLSMICERTQPRASESRRARAPADTTQTLAVSLPVLPPAH
jgi:uncharacterized membrane protein